MHPPLVSIIIVNWNGKKWLSKCLGSLLSQTYKNIEIIFVDNASTDDSVEFVRTNFPTIKVVQNEQNYGFAKGNNVGVVHSNGEYLMFLNTDVWVEPNFVGNLLNFIISNNYDVVAPLGAYYDGKIRGKYAIRIDPFGHHAYLFGSQKNNFYLSGVCLLFSKKTYQDTQGLDQDFFMYCEEVDWFWRLNLLKKRFAHDIGTYIYHAVSGSTGLGLRYNIFLWRNQNTLQMLLKNYAWYNLCWVIPLYLLQNCFEMFAFLVIGKPKIALSYLQGWVFNIRNLRRTLKKRKWVQQSRLISDWEILRLMFPGPAKLVHLYYHLKERIYGKPI